MVVRVRRSQEQAWLTLKAPTSNPEIRHEFEYPIPPTDADALLALTPRRVEKTRHHLNCPGGDWVVDVFAGANAPLVIAEVERSDPEAPLTFHPGAARRSPVAASSAMPPWPCGPGASWRPIQGATDSLKIVWFL